MIFYVEDDNSIREIVLYTLHSMGFEARGFEDGQSFLKALENHKPSLIMLDVMLPDYDGVELLKIIKRQAKTSDLPVIMATARGAEIEKIQALDLGADDYLAKPFSMMEMVARVKAVLRRYKKEEPKSLTAGPLSLDENSHVVKEYNRVVELTYKEYELLALLLKHQGRVYSREQILDLIWGHDYDGENRTVDVHIRTLRSKLGESANLIKTVRGVGYKLEY
ncbi:MULTISPECIES: response regulator transcription factor [unclassified Anaerobiospirillum]|uniref:winged helix-turn-helix domain-containing protein n=1 Tax=unclassified Anaerobiospirillum TaxID=2647410 RepID=UPI001FF5F44B|nr:MULTISPECIES: response regulator transcription factor [unclassified Anaerobiospirillum]MCK0526685.1 response regulator transcription factor [Anaerobiospirillum sp. NML120449]MCK0534314.1 response regulator transcription factor [Anaerobiospirillum sp. NML120511]MCK0539583.1 response regulator transcription factor [Anaerobiospirillum sp. NML02-A-032]